MNTNSKRLGIYLAAMLLATAVATALRTVACVLQLDFSSGFFTDRSLITVSNTIVAVTVFGMLTYLFTTSRIKLRASFSTGSTYVPTGMLGVASAFLGARVISYVLVASNYRPFDFRANSLRELIAQFLTPENMRSIIGLLAAVLAFASIAYYFFNAFVTDAKDVTRAYFSIVAIVFLALYSVLIYLDGSIALNEAAKTLRQTSFLTAAIFFLYEARISLGREMWRIYTAFGLVAATLTAYTSIPAIITYYVKSEVVSTSGYKSLASIEEYVFLLALFIFIVARLSLTATLSEEKENELVKAIATAAEEREARVNESLEMHEEIFASKQLSIFELYGEEETAEEEETERAEVESEEPDENEPMISDDAIYESIFGKMPPKPDEEPIERDVDEVTDEILKIVAQTEENGADI